MAKSKTAKTKTTKDTAKKKHPAKRTEKSLKATKRSDVSAFEPLQTLRRQVDDLFTNFTVTWPHFEMPKIEWPVLAGADTGGSIAKFDLSENGKSVKVVADIPGVDEKGIEVLVQGGVLTIKGEKKSEREEEGEDFYVSERSFGSFSRAFRLPEGVDEQAVDANFDSGVLTVTLPKLSKKKTGAQRVPVKSK
jgi:HSP20 family protein